jgi:hypothetical protein
MDIKRDSVADRDDSVGAVADELEFTPLATPDDTETDEKITIVGINACR